ncbi:hypothetical protein Gpo141_00003886 [Globisporangium polare]
MASATRPRTPSNSTSPTSLRDWVAATNKGTRRFLSHWWAGNTASQSTSQRHSQVSDSSGRTSSSSFTSSPSPVVVAAICAPDSEERPVESAQQFCYTSYDSGDESDDDEALKLELLKQIAMNGEEDHAPQSWSSSQASYFMYSSQKSGSAA